MDMRMIPPANNTVTKSIYLTEENYKIVIRHLIKKL